MNADYWKRKIKTSCRNVGTYKKEFDAVINTLRDILEIRDRVFEQFVRSGGNAIINYTNKGGATNLIKNPLLVSMMELNNQRLTYWRDLGLTPAGLKKLSDDGGVINKSTQRLTLYDRITKRVE